MDRIPDFKNDYQIGLVGEDDFKEVVGKSPKTVELADVSQDPIFQLIDIDFIQITKPGYTVDDVRNAFIHHEKKRDYFNAYEVKTDTRSEETRNIVYEIISHNNPGCGAISRADYFYYVFVDRKENDVIKERWLIDMKKWRHLMTFYYKWRDKVKFKSVHESGEDILNSLSNIDFLEEKKIAQKVIPQAKA